MIIHNYPHFHRVGACRLWRRRQVCRTAHRQSTYCWTCSRTCRDTTARTLTSRRGICPSSGLWCWIWRCAPTVAVSGHPLRGRSAASTCPWSLPHRMVGEVVHHHRGRLVHWAFLCCLFVFPSTVLRLLKVKQVSSFWDEVTSSWKWNDKSTEKNGYQG